MFSTTHSSMAFKAGEILLTAKELDGDAVDGGMVMGATCFSIYFDAFDCMVMGHIKSSFLARE